MLLLCLDEVKQFLLSIKNNEMSSIKIRSGLFHGLYFCLFIPFDFLAINNAVIDSHFRYSVLEYISAIGTLKNVQYLLSCFM